MTGLKPPDVSTCFYPSTCKISNMFFQWGRVTTRGIHLSLGMSIQSLGIWVFPKIGGKPPKWMVKIMENPINPWMIWGENPQFSEASIYNENRSPMASFSDCLGLATPFRVLSLQDLSQQLFCLSWHPGVLRKHLGKASKIAGQQGLGKLLEGDLNMCNSICPIQHCRSGFKFLI